MHADIGAVLSDMDGTLLDTEEAWLRAVAGFVRSRGAEAGHEVMLAVEGATLTQAARVVRRMLELPDAVAEIEAELDARALEQFTAHGVRWRPGARELIAVVAASGTPLALVTSSPRRWVDDLARRVDLGVFRVTVTADDVDHVKPDPTPYLLGAAALGVPPESAVVLEDSIPGMRSALQAGCRVLLIRPGERPARHPSLVVVPSLDGISLPWLRERFRALADVAADIPQEGTTR
ncbi:MAG: HAD family phosphatase [Microbacteriaceae bacterium]|nr:MAG: HAD family phosphatase [Microbacteriaceae bacterium]